MFQKIGRWWLTGWYGFSDKYPGLAKLVYMVFFFAVFSMMVTVLQMLLFLFLPNLFGFSDTVGAGVEFFFPYRFSEGYGNWIIMGGSERIADLSQGQFFNSWTEYFPFFFLGQPITYNDAGVAIIGGGLGYFISVMIATFLAQVVNFPLQRNITFKSKGNVPYQIMWYFIGWLLIQPFVSMLGALWKAGVAVLFGAWPQIIIVIIDTFITGGVSMVIFFFVFLAIFPNLEKLEKSAKAKLDGLKAKNAPGDKIQKAEKAHYNISMKAKNAKLDRAASKAVSQANARALSYHASQKAFEKAKAALDEAKALGGAKLSKAQLNYAVCQDRVEKKHQAVSDAKVAKEKAVSEYETFKPEFEAFTAQSKKVKA